MARAKENKMAAVRQALSALGKSAKPMAIQEHLKSAGVSMSTNMISNYKTNILKKGRKRGRPKGKRSAKAAPAPAAVRVRAGISMADIQAVKKLTDRMGVAKVKELATVLGK